MVRRLARENFTENYLDYVLYTARFRVCIKRRFRLLIGVMWVLEPPPATSMCIHRLLHSETKALEYGVCTVG